MIRHHWSREIIARARELRTQGLTFHEIIEELHVPKSTLSGWVADIQHPNHIYFTDRKTWLSQFQRAGVAKLRQKKTDRIALAVADVKLEIADLHITPQTKKAMLGALYWCEGTKVYGTLTFANTDARLILLFITLLRDCYELDETKLRVRLHLHYYHREQEVRRFWSELLGIPESQFQKTYRKHRSKEKTFRRNLGGICFVRYNSEDLRERITQYAFALGEKITGPVQAPIV